jgi:PAS domain S-box-containing protein
MDIIILLLVGLIFFYLGRRWYSRQVSRSLRELRMFIKGLSQGDFTRRAPPEAKGELGRIARELNLLSDNLQNRLRDIRRSDQQLESILHSMQEGVIVLNQDERIVFVNDAAGYLLNFQPREAIGHYLWEVIRLERLMSLMQEAKTKGGSKGEIELVIPRYQRIGVSISLVGPKNLEGIVIVLCDLTQMDRYDRLRKEFIANVSHELRTPLTFIKGYIETLLEGAWCDQQKCPEFLSITERHVHQLANLVDDLLQLSHLDLEKVDMFKFHPVNIGGLLGTLINSFTPAFNMKRQVVERCFSPDGPTVTGNYELLERAVRNLLENAHKYTPEGGQIKVTVESVNNLVNIHIQDNGIGIPQDALPRIFERFYRVDKSRSRELGGTGLGLAIVKHIALLHKGSVSVKSSLGFGSTFTLSLPQDIIP